MRAGTLVYCDSIKCIWYSNGSCEKDNIHIELGKCMNYEVKE